MREYFRELGIEYVAWGDEPPYFTDESRGAYFGSVPDSLLRDALVFLDPDVGLSSGRLTPKHLAFEELASIYGRLNNHAIAVVYQHRWRRTNFWESMASEIRRRLNGPVGYVADPSVAFYVCPKHTGSVAAIDAALNRVGNSGRLRSVRRVQF